MTSCARDHNGQ